MKRPALAALCSTLALAVAASGTMSAAASNENATITAKIHAFDVFGIRLGMTPAQVNAALAKHGFSLTSGIDPSVKGDLTHSGLCANDYIKALRAGKAVPYIWSEEDGGKCVYLQQPAYMGNVLSWPRLLIYYCEDYPARPGVMRVVEVNVSENVETDADAKAFRQAIFSRMGRKPTWQSTDRSEGSYCSLNYTSAHIDLSPCQVDTAIVSFDPGRYDPSKEHGVTLDYSSSAGTVTLQDRDFIIAHRTSAWKAIQATRSPVKTPF